VGDKDDWQYEPVPDIDQSIVERLQQFPREPDMLMYGLRAIAAITLRTWLKVYHRFTIRGGENLPLDGSFIMVANHTSHLDALCLLSALPISRLHQAFPAAAKDYFFVSLPRVALAAVLVNAMPFSRQVHVRQSLEVCRRLLEHRGNVLILFPEGTRSSDGALHAFRPGIGNLAGGLDVPVVPCALEGCFQAWPRAAWGPRPRKVQLTIGQPRSYGHLPPGRESMHCIAEDLHFAIQNLLST
jgi:1-acyl-sn-glycerol-3-phosphate acyltransferase